MFGTMDGSMFKIGPERVVPLCLLAEKNPEVVDKITLTDVYDYYEAVDGYDEKMLTDREVRVFEAMKGKGPMSKMEVIDNVTGLWVIEDELTSMVKKGAVTLSALTPTDIMVFYGDFKLGSEAGSRAGIHAIAEKSGMTEKQAARAMFDEIKTKVAQAVMTKMLDDQMLKWQGDGSEILLRRMLTLHHNESMNMKPEFNIPIVGIGAPSKYMMEDLDERLGAKVVFPENNDVGNAIGAISSKIVESLSANVIPTPDYRFLATIPFTGTSYHMHLGNAISSCKRSLENYLKAKLENCGARNIVTSSKIKTFMASEGGIGDYTDEGLSGTVNYVEIISRAVGDPPES